VGFVQGCSSARRDIHTVDLFETVTMNDKNTEIRVAVVSFRTVAASHCYWHLIPHRHWWLYGSNQSDSRALVSGRHRSPPF
jgi:hypothetical protein